MHSAESVRVPNTKLLVSSRRVMLLALICDKIPEVLPNQGSSIEFPKFNFLIYESKVKNNKFHITDKW